MGVGVGPQGSSYAIPTMQGGPETIQPYVDEFVEYASQHPEQVFLVTPIGCGIAGFEPADIAPLFANAVGVDNIYLPKSFGMFGVGPSVSTACSSFVYNQFIRIMIITTTPTIEGHKYWNIKAWCRPR